MTQIEIVQMLSVRWSCTNTSELPSASPEQKLHQNAKLPNTTARVLGFGWEGIGSPGDDAWEEGGTKTNLQESCPRLIARVESDKGFEKLAEAVGFALHRGVLDVAMPVVRGPGSTGHSAHHGGVSERLIEAVAVDVQRFAASYEGQEGGRQAQGQVDRRLLAVGL